MATKKENPGALAGAHRVEVTPLLGKNDHDNCTAGLLSLQVRRVLARYAVSAAVAVVVAEVAFSSGRGS
jgi:hypothetical protein